MTGPTLAPQSLTRVCPNCRGFASAAVTSGLGRDHHGHLPTITVDCPACHGHGTIPVHAVQMAGARA